MSTPEHRRSRRRLADLAADDAMYGELADAEDEVREELVALCGESEGRADTTEA